MDLRYESYCFTDPVFYDAPQRPEGGRDFAVTHADPPSGWQREENGVWIVWRPPGVVLPNQGWKIHVSACLDNAEQVLDTIRGYCLRHGVTMKFLRGQRVLLAHNSKYAGRASSGKLATIYPVDDEHLHRVLTGLDELLHGQPGPYILSDLRWNAGPLHVRYGGFARRYCLNGDGERVLAIADPAGELVPDERRPVFDPPSWAPIPDFLTPQLAARQAATLEGFPYRIEQALHFSNGGGVYLAEDTRNGTMVVLKEARPYAGWDRDGADAVSRLRRERDMLEELAGTPEVPQLHDELTWWEHYFLAESFVDGNTLNHCLVQRYPLIHPEPDEAEVASYTEWAIDVLDRIEVGLRGIHERGVVFGDLHPSNLLVTADGRVSFVDFELATTSDDKRRPALAAAGYAAPRGCTGMAADRYAMACLRLYLFMPLIPLLQLDSAKADELLAVAARRFPLPDGFTASVTEGLHPPGSEAGTESPPPHRLAAAVSSARPDWRAVRGSLAAGIVAGATPERSDRLFPGDIEQFTHGGRGFAYGAAGTLYALWRSGARRYPAYESWLLDSVRNRRAEPGFYTGEHGVAYVLDQLGHHRQALRLLDELLHIQAPARGLDLHSGLAGDGLTYLHFAGSTGEHGYVTRAVDIAERIATCPLLTDDGNAGSRPAGLLHGASGPALLMLRLFDVTGDGAYLDLAERALRRDLDRCTLASDGALQVDEGFRIVPYLATGSVGIGFVLHEFLRHRPGSELRTQVGGIRRAAEAEFVIQPGLFNGRAGLISYLAALRADPDTAGADTAHLDRIIDQHLRRLPWHLLSYRGELVLCGDQLLRLSMDLATGSAGLLLALHATHTADPVLPFLAGRRHSRLPTPAPA